VRAWLAIAIVVVLGTRALAHQSSVKYVDLAIDGRRVAITFTVAPGDLTEPLGLAADARPTAAEAARPAVAPYVAGWLAVGGAGCTSTPPTARADGDQVVVAWQVECSESLDRVELDFTRFFALEQRHEAVVQAHAPGEAGEPTLVRASDPVVVVRADDTTALGGWVLFGMGHIHEGADHICFVLALLVAVVLVRPRPDQLATRTLRAALRATALVITAFTIAHSVSLIAAALGWIALPSRLVESVIALSIIYTAVENVVRPDAPWRFWLTVAFGLAHGLGFASQLEERLPPTAVVLPLLGFNLGVELGQLTIVVVALPLAWGLARALGADRYRRYVLPVTTAALVTVGLKWLIERAFM
jgi:hypothetical protein